MHDPYVLKSTSKIKARHTPFRPRFFKEVQTYIPPPNAKVKVHQLSTLEKRKIEPILEK
jgi:hypothetical protein